MKKLVKCGLLGVGIFALASCVDGEFPWKERGYQSPMVMLTDDRFEEINNIITTFYAAQTAEDFETMASLLTPNVIAYKGKEDLIKIWTANFAGDSFHNMKDIKIIFATEPIIREDQEFVLVKFRGNLTYGFDESLTFTNDQLSAYIQSTKGWDIPIFHGTDSITSPVIHMSLLRKEDDGSAWKMIPHDLYRYPQYARDLPDEVRKMVTDLLNK